MRPVARRCVFRPAKRVCPTILLVLGAVGGCAWPWAFGFPEAVVPATPTAADWPDVGFAILEDVATLEYKILQRNPAAPARAVAVLDHRRRVKILREGGLAAATVLLPTDDYSTVTKVAARSVSPTGDIDAFDPATIVSEPWADDFADVTKLRQLRVEIPGAQVGGLVEIRYRRLFRDPGLVPPWVFGGAAPVIRSELSIVAEPGLRVDYRYGRGGQLVEQAPMRRDVSGNRLRLVFVERDLPAFFSEPNMPHLATVAPWVAPVLTDARVGDEIVRMQTWEQVAEKVWQLVRRVGGEPLSGMAAQRYQAVRDAVRVLDLPGLGILAPVPAEAVMAGVPVTSRDAAAVLLAAMQDGELPAYLALLTTPSGPPLVNGFAALYPFDRAVVAVDVRRLLADGAPNCQGEAAGANALCSALESGYALLDAGCRQCRFGELQSHLTGGHALLLLPDGARWIDVPIDSPERNRTMARYEYTLEVDGSLRGEIEFEALGAVARAARARLQAASRPRGVASAGGRATTVTVDTQETIILQDAILGYAATAHSAVQSFELEDLRAATLPVRPLHATVRVTGRVRGDGDDDQRIERYSIQPAVLFGTSIRPEWRLSRRYPALLDGPFLRDTTAVVALPAGYRAAVAPPVKLVNAVAEYKAGFAQRGSKLHYSRRFVVKKQVIAADEWGEFAALLSAVAVAEAEGVVVEPEPERGTSSR